MNSPLAQLSTLRHQADKAMDAAIAGLELAQANATEPTPVPAPQVASLAVDGACALDVERFCASEARVLALLREVQDSVPPAKMLSAMRSVHVCMALHAEELTPACVESLATDIVGSPESATATPQLAAKAPEDDSSVEINIYYSKHHRGPLRHGAMSLSSSDAAHPFLWLLVLPFFLVGLYVSVKKGVLYARRRREERRIEGKQQYVPVH